MIADGQLRWAQFTDKYGDPSDWHLSWDGRETICGVVLYWTGSPESIARLPLGGQVPEPRCADCLAQIKRQLDL